MLYIYTICILCYILHIITSQNVTISTGQFLTGLQILKLCLNNQATSTDLGKWFGLVTLFFFFKVGSCRV